MTATVSGLDQAPTTHQGMLDWVRHVAELTAPARVVWCDGSDQEWRRLTIDLVTAGTLVRLSRKPHSFWAGGDPADVVRVADHSYLCSRRLDDAGPTNTWMDPLDMTIIMTEHYRGCMAGRSLYVVPFCLGPLDSPHARLGVRLTDSAYVVACTRIMVRTGKGVLDRFVTPDGTEAEFIRELHSVGAPRKPGKADIPWPHSPTTYVAHFPELRTRWSYGSASNTLPGIDGASPQTMSVIARDEGWLAERMTLLKVTSPDNTVHYLAAAGAGGTIGRSMPSPASPGWRVDTLGAGTAWLRCGEDGRLYAVNPEHGLSGLAEHHADPVAMRAFEQGNTIFTRVGLTDDGDVWWEGKTDTPPIHLTDWAGRDWTPHADRPATHPNSRFHTPIQQHPTLAPEWDDPNGVPISAILLGARRTTTIPLVTESRDWRHGVFLGATLSTDTDGEVSRDPMGMRDFLGYHAGDYLAHWLFVGGDPRATALPTIFQVNWIRHGDQSSDTTRVLAWIVGRLDGTATATDTPIGWVPDANALDLTEPDTEPAGTTADITDITAALAVDTEEWQVELRLIEDWFATFGDHLPVGLRDELHVLRHRLQPPS